MVQRGLQGAAQRVEATRVEVVTQPGPRVRRGLVVLGLATTCLVCAVVLLPRLAHLFLARSSDSYDEHVPFNGWQVDVAEAALGLLLATTIVLCVLVVKRRWVALRGRTPYLRAPVLMAALPAIALGGVLEKPLTSVVTWASNHTAAAAATREQFQDWLANDGPTPVLEVAPPSALPVPGKVAAHLLRPSDLGVGWYDTTRPNPYSFRVYPQALGVRPLWGVRLSVLEQHRIDGRWHRDHLVWEDLRHYATAADAQRALPALVQDPQARSGAVRGVPVWRRGHSATFVLGSDVYVVLSHVSLAGPLPPERLDTVVDAAVRRALGR